ncbi:adenine deaminase [Salsuginibacillus kocurii]|uniref:adenine deaminase n=1 Tax=Salsuginibacillus kocurii TaxID=427078 RepID=UPI00035DE131|nr:adenine deaminase [Salsuginibacillus kocurii]
MIDAIQLRRLQVAKKERKAERVITGATFADVFNREWKTGDIAIQDGKIVGIGSYEGEETIDAAGAYVVPGLIDGHVHIESSMVTPSEFANVVLKRGVTTIVTDPHEIANVAGNTGIRFMIEESRKSLLSTRFMLPSCVPATSFEHNGATLDAADLAPLYEEPEVLGLAEVMNYPAVENGEADMMKKLADANEHLAPIDGHAAGLNSTSLNVYRTAGIRSDHEATTYEEGKERLERGFHLMIREGSGAKDLDALLPLITEANAHRFLFVTDDKHLDDLLENGSIDHHIRRAVAQGVAPLTAIAIATLHAAQCFDLREKGAIAPGFDADLVFIDNPEDFHARRVFQRGTDITASEPVPAPPEAPSRLSTSVTLGNVTARDLDIPISSFTKKAKVIGVRPGSIVTERLSEHVDTADGVFIPSVEKDQLKLAVFERHHGSGAVGTGIVKGFGFTAGAIASTIGHDSHNLLVCGTNDEDMLAAVRHVEELQGGVAAVKDREVLADIPLSVGGLMSAGTADEVVTQIEAFDRALEELGFVGDFNPLINLSFLALPVIPSLKLTDQGLFDVEAFEFLPVAEEE